MARRNISRSLLLTLALGLPVPVAGGCVVRTQAAVVVDSPPPPPRRTRVEVRPGFVWVEGTWAYQGNQWVWRDGYWERERAGYVYVQGRWSKRGGRWHWVEPRWDRGHARGQIRVRHDQRRPRRPAVREHRRARQPAVRDRRAPRQEPRGDRDARDRDRDRIRVRDHR